MRLFSNKKNQSNRSLGERRSVIRQTPPKNTFFYHSQRSYNPVPSKRQTLRNPLRPQTVSRIAKLSIQRFGLIIVIIVSIISLINVLAISSPTIKLLDRGQIGYLHTQEQYQQATQRLFSSSFVNSNKITIDTVEISDKLMQQFPELADVNIKIPFIGRNPIVYFSPNNVLVSLSTQNGKSYAIDSNGQVVGNIVSTSFVPLHLIDIQDLSSAPIHIGQPILSSDTVAYIQTILFQVEQHQLAISKLVLPAGVSELDMYIAGQSYFVKFNLNDTMPLQEVGTFLAVQHYLQGKSITPSLYIDVRVDGRAYYK